MATMLKNIFGENPDFTRWFIFFIAMSTVLVSVLSVGGADFLIENDITNISWVIVFILVVGSLYLGYRVNSGERLNQGVTDYLAEMCTAFGLLGTIIGLIVMISGAFGSLNISDPESVKVSLLAMSSGIGSALTTTLTGIIASILLTFQKRLVETDWT